MNAIYFAIGCILIVLAIYWGSAQTEPAELTKLFGRAAERKPDSAEEAARKKKRRW
jgi:uncharacterized membrane protein YvbJ